MSVRARWERRSTIAGALVGLLVAWWLLAGAGPSQPVAPPSGAPWGPPALCSAEGPGFAAAVDALASGPPADAPAQAHQLAQRWRRLAADAPGATPPEVVRQLQVVREDLAVAAASGRYAVVRAEAEALDRLRRTGC